ncbi:phosphate-starvation-inducible PsiE family protein [Synechococcus sp. PCC 7336]|uniref:phosphate-starvation-inducible PsiE family protein n=1 Tax=Synechococcus sp. PCC 7336 TaxID=195250 RepID=UPI0003692A90|nr:phosphate-starvation-inducible PsiE family protein [Synechococcus sp. PCC 7336]
MTQLSSRSSSSFSSSSNRYPTSHWYSWFNRSWIVRTLEATQDLIVVSLCIGLLGVMAMELVEMFRSMYPQVNFGQATSDILTLLIFVELFRLLVMYLQEHEISIEVAMEVSIVSVLREIIVRGILETASAQILCASVFLLVLGGLLSVRNYMKHRNEASLGIVQGPFCEL